MEQVELRILARKMERQCGFAIEAAERLKLGIDARNEEEVWHAIQAFFVSAGIISRLLWAGQTGISSAPVTPSSCNRRATSVPVSSIFSGSVAPMNE